MTNLFGFALQPSDVLALCAIPFMLYAIVLHFQIKRDGSSKQRAHTAE